MNDDSSKDGIIHALINDYTLCGRHVNQRWYVGNDETINCSKCLKIISDRTESDRA
jgi:hypothetical protein